MDPLLPSIALALIASFQGALMFGPAHRAARMYFKVCLPPRDVSLAQATPTPSLPICITRMRFR